MLKSILHFKVSKHALRKNKAGFTLVELLVVIAIIGILSSVAVINLNSSRNLAKNVSVFEHLSKLTTVIHLCAESNKEFSCTNDYSPMSDSYCGVLEMGGQTDNPPSDGLWGGLPVEICQGIGTYWPNIARHGWNYNQPVLNLGAKIWFIGASSGGKSVSCNEKGCVKVGF